MITALHLITKLELGGAQENTLDTCERLDRTRFRVALIYGPGGILDVRARAMQDVYVEPLPLMVREIDPLRDAKSVIALAARIRVIYDEHLRLGFDRRAFIVHTHSSKAGILGRFAARVARVPVIVHSIHGFSFHEGQARSAKTAFIAAELAASRWTTAFVSVSRASLGEAQARGIVRPRHVARVIRSGFDLAPFRAAASAERRAAARAALGVPLDAELIVCVANLKPQKDPLTMLEAFASLAASRPKAICLYAGDGELRAAVEKSIAAFDLGDRFRLLGWREDVPELFAAADVIALASIFEGLPRTAVQALVARKPFVGTRVDGTPEVIREGKNGFLVPPRDPPAFAQALARALDERPTDPADVDRVLEWDVDAMVRAEEALYEELTRPR